MLTSSSRESRFVRYRLNVVMVGRAFHTQRSTELLAFWALQAALFPHRTNLSFLPGRYLVLESSINRSAFHCFHMSASRSSVVRSIMCVHGRIKWMLTFHQFQTICNSSRFPMHYSGTETTRAAANSDFHDHFRFSFDDNCFWFAALLCFLSTD